MLHFSVVRSQKELVKEKSKKERERERGCGVCY